MLIQAEIDLLMQLFSGAKDLPRYLHGKLSESSPFRNVDPSDPPAAEPPCRSQKVQGLIDPAYTQLGRLLLLFTSAFLYGHGANH
jgi:hypothetical protein